MATAGTLEYLISIDSSSVNSGLNSAEGKVKNFGNRMSTWAVAKGQVLGRMIEKAGAATLSFVKGSVQQSMSFDKAMSQVAATLGKSTEEVQDLAKFARKMGAETAFTAEDAAQGLNYMALAGYDAQTSMKMLPTVLNLAAAGNMELARASDMVTDAQSALGLSLDDTTVLIDQMAKASSKTNTSVEQLGDAILTVGGTAKMLSGGTKELTMTLGVLADNGIKGSEGGTALRNTILALSAPTDKAAKRLKELNVEVYDAQGNMRGLPEIMSDMNEAMSDMTQQERTDILNDIFNKRDLKAAEALLGTSKKRWAELGAEIGDSKDAAAQMAETQLDNLAGDVTKFKSALGETRLTLVEKMTPAFRNFVQAGTTAVQRITDAFKRKGLTGAIKEAWSMLKDVSKSLGSFAKVKIAQWLDLGDDASWGDIALGITKKLKDGIKKKIGKAKVKLANMLGLTDENGEAIKDSSDTSWGKIAEAAFDNIKEKFTNFAKASKVSLANWLGLTDESGNPVDDADDTSWDKIASGMKDKIQGGFKKLKVKLTDLLGLTPSEVGEEVDWADIGKEIINKMTSYFSGKGDFLKKLILGDEFSDGTGGKAKSTWMDVGKKISGWLTEAFSEGGLLRTILGEGADRLSAVISFAGDLLTGIATWISDNSGEFTSMLVTLISSLADAIAQAAGPIITALGEVFSSPDLWKSIVSGLANIGEAILDAILGKDVTNAIRRFFGVDIPGEISLGTQTQMKTAWDTMVKEYFANPADKNQIAAKWNDYVTGIFNNSKVDPKKYGAFMEQFNFDNMLAAYESMDLSDFYASFSNVISSANSASGEIAALRAEAEATAGTYDIEFNISTNGEIPKLFKQRNRPTLPNSNAKGNWNVPYDNYPALLHRGEMVLNKSQARQFRDSEGGGFDMNSVVGNAVSAAMSKVYVMLNGDKVGDLTSKRINKNINATTYNKLRALGG